MKILLLDFDGTLFFTKDAIKHCLEQTMQHFAYTKIDHDAINAVINQGLTLEDSFKILTEKLEHHKHPPMPEMVSYYRTLYNSEIGIQKTSMYPNIAETLRKLHHNSIMMIVVSNKGQAAIENTLNYFGILQYISLVVGSKPGIKSKPDPMIFHEVIKSTLVNHSVDDVLVVGDTVPDLLFAKNISAKSCWARYGYGSIEHCMIHKPDFVIDKFSDLLTILKLDVVRVDTYRV
jgi:phosphoglycolate phosphatase